MIGSGIFQWNNNCSSGNPDCSDGSVGNLCVGNFVCKLDHRSWWIILSCVLWDKDPGPSHFRRVPFIWSPEIGGLFGMKYGIWRSFVIRECCCEGWWEHLYSVSVNLFAFIGYWSIAWEHISFFLFNSCLGHFMEFSKKGIWWLGLVNGGSLIWFQFCLRAVGY